MSCCFLCQTEGICKDVWHHQEREEQVCQPNSDQHAESSRDARENQNPWQRDGNSTHHSCTER